MTSTPAEGPAPRGAGPRPLTGLCHHGYEHGERLADGSNWIHTAAGWRRSGGPPYLVPPALAAELEKLCPWQQRLFWAALAEPGPRRLVIAHGRRNGLNTVRRLIAKARELPGGEQ